MILSLDRCEIECAGQGDPLRLASAIHRQMPENDKSVPVDDIALALDIIAIEEHPFAGLVAALQTDANKSAGMIGVKTGLRSTRRRYSIAHELGHFLNETHEPTDSGGFACSATDMSNPFGSARHIRQEREANCFAIELLTPRARLGPILKHAAELERAVAMAYQFKISREAALRRYVDLHSEVIAVVFSRDGRVRYSHRPDNFPWILPKPGEPLGETGGPPTTGDRINSLDEVNAESWLQRGRDWSLYAQTLFQHGGYAATLLVAEPREQDEPDEPRFR